MKILGMSLREEFLITAFALILTFFLWVNFDPLLGGITFGMLVLYWVALMSRNGTFQAIQIKSPNKKWASTLGIGIVAFAAWIVMANFIYSATANVQFSAFDTSIFSKIAAQTEVPILSTDPTIKLLAYGVDIPIAETLLFFGFVM